MNKHLLARGFSALLLANMGTLVSAQDETEEQGTGEEQRRVRIETSRNENGHTSHITREFDLNNEAELHDALRELGVLDELSNIGEGENVTFDLRRMNADGLLHDMCMALTLPDGVAAFRTEAPEAYLGVYFNDWAPSNDTKTRKQQPPVEGGVMLTEVEKGSPADAAGLVAGDLVVDIGGNGVTGGQDLSDAMGQHAPGDRVKVTYYRGKQKKTAEVVLSAREGAGSAVWNWDTGEGVEAPSPEWDWDQYYGDNGEGSQKAFLGVVGGSDEENGVRIGEVVEGSAAEEMGIQEGDIVRSINGDALTDFGDLSEMVGNMEPGEEVEVSILRDGKPMTLKGKLGSTPVKEWSYKYNMEQPAPPEPPMPPESPEPPGSYDREDLQKQADDEMHARMDEARARADEMRALPDQMRARMDEARAREDEARSRSDEMRREMDQLRQEMDRLRRELRGGITREMHGDISADATLADADKTLLKEKGVPGLDTPLELGSLQAYPEPGTGSFHIEFQVPERGDLSVDVHNAAGERVYHETITGFKGNYDRTLDLSDLAGGTYFLVVGQNGKSVARKLIKK